MSSSSDTLHRESVSSASDQGIAVSWAWSGTADTGDHSIRWQP